MSNYIHTNKNLKLQYLSEIICIRTNCKLYREANFLFHCLRSCTDVLLFWVSSSQTKCVHMWSICPCVECLSTNFQASMLSWLKSLGNNQAFTLCLKIEHFFFSLSHTNLISKDIILANFYSFYKPDDIYLGMFNFLVFVQTHK